MGLLVVWLLSSLSSFGGGFSRVGARVRERAISLDVRISGVEGAGFSFAASNGSHVYNNTQCLSSFA
jgi:hypothetical protein